MKISPFGIEMVKAFEGFFAKPYVCPAGVLTQGYGHTAAAGPPALGGVWSLQFAAELLGETIEKRYAAPVRSLLKRTPTQGQFDAMVSFAYNVGVGAFKSSSVLRAFNRGDHEAAAAAFALWNKSAGRVLSGLVRRRKSEALAYRGHKDLDFDGRADADEPIYGLMPQAVDVPAGEVAEDDDTTRLTRHVQQRLRALNYHEVGAVDGDFGQRTRGALLAFKADSGLPVNDDIDDAALRALATASPRVASQARATATASDLRVAGSRIAKGALVQKMQGGAVAGGGLLLTVGKAATEYLDTLKPLADAFGAVPGWCWALLALGVGVSVWLSASAVEAARVDDHRAGKAAVAGGE